jgi:NADPH-dependent 2,4-dienoyl-CoA reductase/sulfur reductase-like enzyme
VNSRQNLVALFGLLAAAAAVVFFAISLDRDIYAPGAWELHTTAQEYDLNSFRILRKFYSVVAFAIVGFFAAARFEPRTRLRGSVLVVAGFSTAIEIAQYATGTREGLHSNAFDIGCGALGGLLGALGFNLFSRARRGRR